MKTKESARSECIISGCSSQVCSDETVITTCEWVSWYQCFSSLYTQCGAFAENEECGWEVNAEFMGCMQNYGGPVGCTNPSAINYELDAVYDDGSCLYDSDDCNDSCNTDSFCRAACGDDLNNIGYECVPYAAEGDDCGGYTLACFYDICSLDFDCVDMYPLMADEPGMCGTGGCTDSLATNYNPEATVNDASCEYVDCESCMAAGFDFSLEVGCINNSWGCDGWADISCYKDDCPSLLTCSEDADCTGSNESCMSGYCAVPYCLGTPCWQLECLYDESCCFDNTDCGESEFCDVSLGGDDSGTCCPPALAVDCQCDSGSNLHTWSEYNDAGCLSIEDCMCCVPGDLNEDNAVDILDVVSMVSIILGAASIPLQDCASDLNNDLTVNVQDINLVVNIILDEGDFI